VTAGRRQVRATPAFFDQLDRLLPAEPTGDGRPTRGEFDTFELLKIVDRFAAGFDALPQILPGRPEYRVLVTVGRLVPLLAVVARLGPDGAVELVSVHMDLPTR
jgi:hypothetical protein